MLESTATMLALLMLVVALLYSTVGHGGASGYLASMALLGVSASVMKPTSLALNVLVASITTVQFVRAGHFSWRLFWPFAAASIPAAFLGGAIVLPGQYYKPLIGAVLLFSAWRLVLNRKSVPNGVGEPARPPRLAVGLAIGAGLGLLSGLSGTGGGIFLSPIILLCGWANTKQTAAVSALFILVNSVSGFAGLLSKSGGLPPELVKWFWMWGGAAVAGGLVGSYLGAWKLGMPTLRRLLAIVLIVAGVKLISTAWLAIPVPSKSVHPALSGR